MCHNLYYFTARIMSFLCPLIQRCRDNLVPRGTGNRDNEPENPQEISSAAAGILTESQTLTPDSHITFHSHMNTVVFYIH